MFICTDDGDCSGSGLTRFEYGNESSFQTALIIRRTFIFLCYFLVNVYNRYKLQKPGASAADGVFLIMPFYYLYITCMVIFIFIVGVAGYAIVSSGWLLYIYVIFDYTIDVAFRNSLIAFFAQPGASRQNIKRAAQIGIAVGVVYGTLTTIVTVILLEFDNEQGAFAAHVSVRILYVLGGIVLVCLPRKLLFRRRSFQILLTVSVIEASFALSLSVTSRYCMPYALCYADWGVIVINGLLGPVATLYCLHLDSMYWQGQLEDESNPLNGVWEVGMDVASVLQNPRLTDVSEFASEKCPIIHFGMITIEYNLGVVNGGFSKVFFGYFRAKKVAIKMLFLMELTPESIREFYKEANVLHLLRSPYVIDCKGVVLVPPAIGVVMEYCGMGSLYSFLYENTAHKLNESTSIRSSNVNSSNGRTNSKVSSRNDSKESDDRYTFELSSNKDAIIALGSVELAIKHNMIIDAIQGLAFLHSKNYMHCDMKSLNYLVTDDLHLKISDLGEAVRLGHKSKRNGPPVPAVNWCPPEVLVPGATADVYTNASDVFGLSMVISEILLKELPLNHLNITTHEEWYQAIVINGARPSIPPWIPPTTASVLQRGWATEPQVRPTAEELLSAFKTMIVEPDLMLPSWKKT